MRLLALTLQPPGAASLAVYGSFSSPSAQEFAVVRGGGARLELWRPDHDTGSLELVHAEATFGCVRQAIPFRMHGAKRDFLVLGADAGRVVVLEFDPRRNAFVQVHAPAYGKAGCRRAVPGQYVAADPQGRALMLSAVEKQKLVYVMNRDAGGQLTISSPLEAHKAHTLVFATVGVDVGFENPLFACLELSYAEADEDPSGEAAREAEKHLTFYELDLGLNHVVRKWSEPTDRGANALVAVPGADRGGPGGVLVLAENWVLYCNMDDEDAAGTARAELRTPIPRRCDTAEERGVLLVATATHRTQGMFFVLAQSEYGDLYKISLLQGANGEGVVDVRVKYFDTLPVAASLCITKTGLLFAASELGDHALYEFRGIGDGDATTEAGCVKAPAPGQLTVVPPTFKPRALTNLVPFDELPSMAPLLQLHAGNLLADGDGGSQQPQLWALCGRSARSSLRMLRHGLAATEMARSGLPGAPLAVWTVPHPSSAAMSGGGAGNGANDDGDGAQDRYIVVSFVNATLVLSIGGTVEEVDEKRSGFVSTAPTLAVGLLADDSIVQVHANGIRHIREASDGSIAQKKDWKPPGKKTIERAAVNERQVAISLPGGELLYFELDGQGSGQLQEVDTKKLPVEIACIDLGAVPEGRQRFPLLLVGGYDNTVRVLSLDPSAADPLMQLSMQALPAHAPMRTS